MQAFPCHIFTCYTLYSIEFLQTIAQVQILQHLHCSYWFRLLYSSNARHFDTVDTLPFLKTGCIHPKSKWTTVYHGYRHICW